MRGADAEVGLRTELLAGMEVEINRLRHLLDNLAGLHDQVLGTLELERRLIEPATWLAPVLAPWRQAIQSKGVRWHVTLAPHLPALSADPDRLAQAIGNLLSNALKYTPPGGSVSVEVTVEDGALCIAVADSGPGIPIQEQERIFVPFHRGPRTGRQPRGMGLGLNIARELVVAHGGRLDLRSAPGQGSRFTIRLPLDAGPS
jgi:signal transduction histidine kinase